VGSKKGQQNQFLTTSNTWLPNLACIYNASKPPMGLTVLLPSSGLEEEEAKMSGPSRGSDTRRNVVVSGYRARRCTMAGGDCGVASRSGDQIGRPMVVAVSGSPWWQSD